VEWVFPMLPLSGTGEIWYQALQYDTKTNVIATSVADTGLELFVSPDPLLPGEEATFTVSNAVPRQRVHLFYTDEGLGSTFISNLNVTLGLANARSLGAPQLPDANRTAIWVLPMPDPPNTLDFSFQAAARERMSNVVSTSVVVPDMVLTVDPDPLRAGQDGVFTITNAKLGKSVYLFSSRDGLGSTFIPALNVDIGLANPNMLARGLPDATGTAEFTVAMPKPPNPFDIWYQAAQDERVSNLIETQIVP
jgi:hypothetical protein